MHSLFSIVALGFDSFLACTLIGTRSLAPRRLILIPLAFGTCDAVAAMLGSLWIHRAVQVPEIALFALFLGTWFLVTSRRLPYAAALLFSFDNFLAATPTTIAPALALSSAAMALFGLALGAACRRAFFGYPAEI
jgi:hypothetical protein